MVYYSLSANSLVGNVPADSAIAIQPSRVRIQARRPFQIRTPSISLTLLPI